MTVFQARQQLIDILTRSQSAARRITDPATLRSLRRMAKGEATRDEIDALKARIGRR